MPQIKIINGKSMLKISVDQGTRLSQALIGAGVYVDQPCAGNGKCGKCTVSVNGEQVLSCRYNVFSDIEVIVPKSGEMLSVVGADQIGMLGENNVLCLDIGTTTLALALVSVDKRHIVKVLTATNPQRVFGADVISRIEYCQKNGISQLQNTLNEAVDALIKNILLACGLDHVEKMYVAGNTTMLHTFLGVDCSSIGVSPYTPSFLDSKTVNADLLGLDKVAQVMTLPGVSSFVGADIVAGLNYVGAPQEGKYDLLIDLGTNAEIVLFSRDKAYATAAAAGPCFEGANISCGMSALDGAISAYGEDGKYSVIGNSAPIGICATGLIDLIAYLLKTEYVDDSGYMEDEVFCVADGVELTQKDVREFQLAKSAVISAILCLINKAGITFGDIGKIYVAGGFSAGIDKQNAAYVGLVPKELVDSFVAVNNSSLLGTVKCALDGGIDTVELRNAQYVDLSADGRFSELFFENMGFDI